MQERPAPVAILNAGRVRLDHEATPVRVNQRMTFAPVDLLAGIITARAASLRGLDALAVDDRGRRTGFGPTRSRSVITSVWFIRSRRRSSRLSAMSAALAPVADCVFAILCWFRAGCNLALTPARMPAVLLEAGSIINRQEELELATPERRLVVAEAVTAAVADFCAGRGKLSLLNRRRATQPVLQSPRLPEASGRRRSRVISAFIPQKRSRLLNALSSVDARRRASATTAFASRMARPSSPVAQSPSNSVNAPSIAGVSAGFIGAMWPQTDFTTRHSPFGICLASYSASTGGK